MRARRLGVLMFGLALAVLIGSVDSRHLAAEAPPSGGVAPAFHYGLETLTPAEEVGAAIWFNATAGNARFFTYVYPQRLGVTVDWYRVLASEKRAERFRRWGLINDPDCCRPGDPKCWAKSYEETYGFDYCPGDEELLKFVGKDGYRDPACALKDVAIASDDPHGPKDQRQSPCDLEFGTSTGALGLRKFPNPKFDKAKWLKINDGRLDNWDGYTAKVIPRKDRKVPAKSHLFDASIEPPFRIGMSCGACHIAFNPLHPPKDPEHPEWKNLSGTVGNQYARFAQILGSGMPLNTIEYQVFAHARPGTVDTSAIPNDQVNNAGTMNAIINLAARPTFEEDIIKWRKTNQCPAGADERACWCEPGRDNKCWERGRKTEKVHHILKGGEDSIGIKEAVQRVYFNIGSCSEEGWVNHQVDMRQLDPTRRGYGQTPFDIGQVRRDCAQFRAIEDRLGEVVAFLMTGAPADLYEARGLKDNRELVKQLDKEFGKGAVERGRLVFAQTCASCHSSQNPPFVTKDFRAVSTKPEDKGIRIDWLGNDQIVPVTEIGTSYSRALHSNHMKGRVWEEYGSETLRAKPAVDLKEPSDGGRGYYRNISLLSLWAYAPFMHNNGIGPEVCGGKIDEHYHSPYVDQDLKPVADPPPCWAFDPSVEGRFKLYKESMQALLNPDQRIPKVTRFNTEVTIKLLPRLVGDEEDERFLETAVIFPADTPPARVGNFRFKELVADFVVGKRNRKELQAKYEKKYGAAEAAKVVDAIMQAGTDIIKNAGKTVEIAGSLREIYSNSLVLIENQGHRFGEDLSDQDKKALTAFLATL